MKFFAEFYQLSNGYIDGTIPPQFSEDHIKPIRVLGDRGLIYIDGRLADRSIHAIAADECKKRGYMGYKLGISINGNTSRLFSLDKKTDLQTIGERINARGNK